MKTVHDLRRVTRMTMEAAIPANVYGEGTASDSYPRFVYKVATAFARDTYAVEQKLYENWSSARACRHELQRAASQAVILSMLQVGDVVIFPSEQEIDKYVTSELPTGFVNLDLGLQRLFAVRLPAVGEQHLVETHVPILHVIPFKVGMRARTLCRYLQGSCEFEWIADAYMKHKRWLTSDAFPLADNVVDFIKQFIDVDELYQTRSQKNEATLYLVYIVSTPLQNSSLKLHNPTVQKLLNIVV